jgi:hypothetical protein
LQENPPTAGQAGRPAWIESVMFQGPLQRIALVGADGTPLIALITADSSSTYLHSPLTSGERCWAVWEAADERRLPADHPNQAPATPSCLSAHVP